MAERLYDVILACEASKVVRIKATSMKEARRLATSTDDYESETLFGTEHYGTEKVLDVVRAGDPWHYNRKPSDSTNGATP